MTEHATKPQAPVIAVRLGATPENREEAIRQAAALLAENGCVPLDYAESMLRREQTADTFLGAGVAIPHGTLEDKGLVRCDGIAVLQVPAGIEWSEGRIARIIVGIAAASDGHIAILRRLAGLIQDEARMNEFAQTQDAECIRTALSEENSTASAPVGEDLPHTLEWTLDYPAGLHARPATVWVTAAKKAGIPLRVRHENGTADPRNLIALLQLGIRDGDRLVLSADGTDPSEVLTALYEFHTLLASLTEQEKLAAQKAAARAAAATTGWTPPASCSGFHAIQGVPAGPGLAIGRVLHLNTAKLTVDDKPQSLAEDGTLLEAALHKTRQQMKALVDDTTRRLGAADAAIFQAQAALLDDTDLLASACRYMVSGHGAAWSWHKAIEDTAEQLASLGNAVLAGRAADLRDIGRRVLLQLDPSLEQTAPTEYTQSGAADNDANIIIADDLSPSDTANLNPETTSGFATASGGPTSHTAILARTLGISAVVAAGADILTATSGTVVIVDGDAGRVWLSPPEEALVSARQHIEQLKEKRAAEAAHRGLPARTTDGVQLDIAANVNRPDQVPGALELGAEGVGLMRTEFLFLERGDTPTEDEQYEIYSAMVSELQGRPLIVRALDIGGDKQVAHLSLPHEDNPFLGVRGSRLLLRRPDLLMPQLRALYRVAKDGGKLSIMFPMITTIAEVRELRAQCDAVRAEINAPTIPLGIMIEVPAAAAIADMLAEHVDFFSVGTNDLTQYTLAMDRQNPVLAPDADSMHPAVLRLIQMTVTGAKKHGRWVGICGGLAGDPLGAALLAGLGVTELSMTPRDIPAVKTMLRSHSLHTFTTLAQRALNMENPAQVRALASDLTAR